MMHVGHLPSFFGNCYTGYVTGIAKFRLMESYSCTQVNILPFTPIACFY